MGAAMRIERNKYLQEPIESQRYYIQSAFEMRSPDKEYQEIRPYTAIEDFFKKIVVTKDHIKLKRDENGIVTISIYDFLLKADSLDL